MKKLFATLLTLIFLANTCFAASNLDTSVDSEIRKNYQVDKNSLPPLPQIFYSEPQNTTVNYEDSIQTFEPIKTTKSKAKKSTSEKIVLKSGTKLKLKSRSTITDRTGVGTVVSFRLLYPVTTTYFTIPSETLFYGKVIETHPPQITGNGGLIIINLTSARINGKRYKLNARVTNANSKKIFFNNIKGKRKYLRSLPKTITWGRSYKNKMYRATARLSKETATLILCPFSFLFGTVGYAANLLLSPVLALKYKGERITLKTGTDFTFKLSEDLVIE